jgi:hypothetical protein
VGADAGVAQPASASDAARTMSSAGSFFMTPR